MTFNDEIEMIKDVEYNRGREVSMELLCRLMIEHLGALRRPFPEVVKDAFEILKFYANGRSSLEEIKRMKERLENQKKAILLNYFNHSPEEEMAAIVYALLYWYIKPGGGPEVWEILLDVWDSVNRFEKSEDSVMKVLVKKYFGMGAIR